MVQNIKRKGKDSVNLSQREKGEKKWAVLRSAVHTSKTGAEVGIAGWQTPEVADWPKKLEEKN